jgi:outer membrane receptor protein involved in Fe transport
MQKSRIAVLLSALVTVPALIHAEPLAPNSGADGTEAAKSVAADGKAPAKDAKVLEEVVVTARKRTELLQEVPLAVVSFDADELRERGIDRLDELAAAVPGLQQSDLGITSRITLRGINSGDNNAFEQAVGVYVDGIYRGHMNQQQLGLFDLERVEVLKGPQVALYGNSSIGGAISTVTRKPRFEAGGDAQFGYETQYRATSFEGGADVPVSEHFALRLAATLLDEERGLMPNQATGRSEPRDRHGAFRLSGTWQPSDALSVNFRAEHGLYDRLGHIFDALKHVDGHGNPFPNTPYSGFNDGRLDIANGPPLKYDSAFLKTEYEESLLQLDYNAEAFALTSITGYSSYGHRRSQDVDITPQSLISVYQNEQYEQFSQELRLSGKAGARLNWLAGAYFQADDFRNDYYGDFNMPAVLAPAFGLTPELLAKLINPFSRHIVLDQDTRQSALFGHVDWAFTDTLTAGLSLRYQQIRKQAEQAVRGAAIDHVDGIGAMVDTRWLNPQLAPLLLGNAQYLADPTGYVLVLPDGTHVDPALAPNNLLSYQIVSAGVGVPHDYQGLSRRERHPMLEASLGWQVSPELLYYTRWSNGAKAGGFDFLFERGNRNDVEYADEKANVFEAGMKRDWSNVRLNLAAFYGRYENLQVSVFDGGIGFTVGNAASSISKGIEGELIWQLSPHWRTQAQLAYVDFRYSDFKDANCSTTQRLITGQTICDWSGDQTPFVPKLEGTLSLEHSTTVQGWALTQQLRAGYKGEHATSTDNEEQTRQGAYTLLDYRVEVAPPASRWSLAAYGRNLTDRQYMVFTSVIPLAQGGAFVYTRAPGRELGLEARFHF